MRASWAQRVFRVLVGFEVLIAAVGTALVFWLAPTLTPNITWLHTPPQMLLSVAYVAFLAAVVTLTAIVAFVFTAPAWAMVEVYTAWKNRKLRRAERAMWRKLQREQQLTRRDNG